MQPNAGTPQFRFFHIFLQMSVFVGMMLPFGEILVPWFLLKLARPKSPTQQEAGRRLLAFQSSWAIYRVIIYLLVGSYWVSTLAPNIPAKIQAPSAQVEEESEQFNIPGEPSLEPEAPADSGDLLQDARRQRDRLFGLSDHSNLMMLEKVWQQPMILFVVVTGLFLSFLCWFISLGVTALNILVIVRDGRPWYPLTLPWTLRPKKQTLKKNEAGVSPASSST